MTSYHSTIPTQTLYPANIWNKIQDIILSHRGGLFATAVPLSLFFHFFPLLFSVLPCVKGKAKTEVFWTVWGLGLEYRGQDLSGRERLATLLKVEAAAKNDPMATVVFYSKSKPGSCWLLLPLFTSHTGNVYTSLQLGVGFDWTPKHYYGENMDLHFALSIGPNMHTLATRMYTGMAMPAMTQSSHQALQWNYKDVRGKTSHAGAWFPSPLVSKERSQALRSMIGRNCLLKCKTTWTSHPRSLWKKAGVVKTTHPRADI